MCLFFISFPLSTVLLHTLTPCAFSLSFHWTAMLKLHNLKKTRQDLYMLKVTHITFIPGWNGKYSVVCFWVFLWWTHQSKLVYPSNLHWLDDQCHTAESFQVISFKNPLRNQNIKEIEQIDCFYWKCGKKSDWRACMHAAEQKYCQFSYCSIP